MTNIKNIALWVSIGFLYSISITKVLADQISIKNELIAPIAGQNIILQADKSNIQGDDVTWKKQILDASADEIYIGQEVFSQKALYQWADSSQYTWAAIGYKIFLAKSDGTPGPYLGYLDFTLYANPQGRSGILSDVKFSSNGHDQNYAFQLAPLIKYIRHASFEVNGTLEKSTEVTPPIITNLGWESGMGNLDEAFSPDHSFWTQDYGMDEPGRWIVDVANQAISQSTKNISGNAGSRAYPIIKDSKGQYIPGIGDVNEEQGGVWQVDMKIGSNGGGDFCESFYLAERDNLEPGPNNYMDGSGGATGGTGREIDILETKWQSTGPQINLANGNNTSWNADVYQSQKMGNWTDVGGAPTSGFVTFGAYLNGNNLWIYAYKPNGQQWYCTDAIPLNSNYKPKGPLVPYIGTWGSGNGSFSTEYKNFIYLSPDKLGSLNPKDNPDDFRKTVLDQQT